jgi:TetR/AcrR family transcriptional regulator, regulator of cefoperazone and chloramphenicol sensitivity
MTASTAKLSKREQTRAKVVNAAIDCIYEEGFNAAHTNRIAERAGVSWGVLQYHFGDKEALHQAVLDSIFEQFSEALATAQLAPGDLEQRILELIYVVWSQVSKREYRVSISILRNTQQRQRGKAVKQRIDRWSKEIAQLWDRMTADIVDAPHNSDVARRLMFASLRGLADELNPSSHTSKKDLEREFAALASALTYILRQ